MPANCENGLFSLKSVPRNIRDLLILLAETDEDLRERTNLQRGEK